jgi:N-acetylmuramoyl-L-alanine amidase
MRSTRFRFQDLNRILPWIGVGLIVISLNMWTTPRSEPDLQKPIENPVLAGWFDTVVIDPGHGGSDEGASAHGLKEKDLTLDLGQKLAVELQKQGLKTLLTRSEDLYVALTDRVTFANAIPHAIFLSLHCNFSSDTNAKGLEVYRCVAKSAGSQSLVTVANADEPDQPLEQVEEELARSLDDAFVQLLHADNRGQKRENFFVVRNVFYPAVLIECGFLTNAEEARRLGSASYRQQLAQSLATGIVSYRTLVGGNGTKTVSNASNSNVIVVTQR